MSSREKSTDVLSILEKLLLRIEEISSRLDRVERLLRRSRSVDSAEYLSRLLSVVEGPFYLALQSLIRVWIILSKLGRVDPITEAIIYVLSTCSALNIMEIYRRVRDVRGRASRRIIASKLRVLEASGVVVNAGTIRRPRYVLRECLEEKSR
ncbi:MAG: ArsR family transcriptional regulator [Desulfurococcaceae archaeon]